MVTVTITVSAGDEENIPIPVLWVGFQPLSCDLLGFEDEDKNLYIAFSHSFFLLTFPTKSVFIVFSVVFSCWSFTNIQRNTCFHGMFVHYGGVVSNSLLFCMLWARFFFYKVTFLHACIKFSDLLNFTAYFLQIFTIVFLLYMYSTGIHSNIF